MRSGNHAILHFVYRLYGNPKAFFNNNILYEDVKNNKHNLVTKKYIRKKNRELMLISYEDEDVSSIDYDKVVPNVNDLVGNVDRHINMLCIRDPFNTFASRMKFKWTNGSLGDTKGIVGLENMVSCWKVYAKECLSLTNNTPNKIVVNFNTWFAESNYRKSLAESLGQKFKEKKWDSITKEGHGSSWKQKVITTESLISRWRYFKDDDFFRQLFQDDELWELSFKLFGKIDGTEILR